MCLVSDRHFYFAIFYTVYYFKGMRRGGEIQNVAVPARTVVARAIEFISNDTALYDQEHNVTSKKRIAISLQYCM